MTSRHLTPAELRGEQDQAWRTWQDKEKDLMGTLSKLLWLAGLLAGADHEAVESVLGGAVCLPDADIEAAEAGALALLRAGDLDQGDTRRLFAELYRLAAGATVAGGEASYAAGDFVHTLKYELQHWQRCGCGGAKATQPQHVPASKWAASLAELGRQQDQAFDAWMQADESLFVALGKAFALSGLAAGADLPTLAGAVSPGVADEWLNVLEDASAASREDGMTAVHALVSQALHSWGAAAAASGDFLGAVEGEAQLLRNACPSER